MFTASLNLEALKKATKGSPGVCAAEGCDQALPQAQEASAEFCADHTKPQATRSRRSKKARR
jgi:hypothetical protein